MHIHSFPPIAPPDARILILGSMPGVESLRLSQYYAHPRNAFWSILFDLWGETPSFGADADPADRYHERVDFLMRHRIALWDVIEACSRPGSLDADIRNETPNDFAGFLSAHPGIRHFFFNGTKAGDTFRKKVGFALLEAHGCSWTALPSTSPANAMRYADKLNAWRPVVQAEAQRFRTDAPNADPAD